MNQSKFKYYAYVLFGLKELRLKKLMKEAWLFNSWLNVDLIWVVPFLLDIPRSVYEPYGCDKSMYKGKKNS